MNPKLILRNLFELKLSQIFNVRAKNKKNKIKNVNQLEFSQLKIFTLFLIFK